ncbi:UMP-CMP kinase-like protein [Cricetulus griseus]|nr:UMP-CMP kinase-like protein [Cricetulus griseus]
MQYGEKDGSVLRVLVVLAGDVGSVPSTHVVVHSHLYVTSVPGHQMPSVFYIAKACFNFLILPASAASLVLGLQKYGYTHLSAGELLRDERKNPDSQYGELIEKYIKEGKIVPVEITISLLKREMDQTMAANAQKNKFLIDGFPRNQDNLQGWNKTMDGKADVSFVLFFDCDNEICIERCLERGKSSGRSDDNRESLEKRIQTYLQSTKPIIDLYEEMGKVKKIDASKSVDEVFGEVTKIFDKEG